MTQLSLTSWRKKAPSKRSALRRLLSDGRWHGQHEMAKAAGYRYGAALFDLHNEVGLAGGEGPIHYQKKVSPKDDSRVHYRQTDKAVCDICTAEAKAKPSEIIKALRQRIAELEAQLVKLRGQ